MNILQAIDARSSRRAYLDTPIEKTKLATLKNRVEEYNYRAGLTIRLMENGRAAFGGIRKSYGMFTGVRSFFIMKGPQEDPDLKEKLGYYGELLVLEATSMELGTCWVGGTFDASGIRTAPSEELICVITVGNVPDQQTFRERMIYKAIHRKTKSVSEMSSVDGEPPQWLEKGMAAVRKAPSTRNTQKVMFAYDSEVLRASVPDTYKFDYVDLGIAKLHFELGAEGKFELGNNAVFHPQEGGSDSQ